MKPDIQVVATGEEQLQRWVDGQSTHWDRGEFGIECCPDFSCCKPEFMQPLEVRQAFQVAGPEQRERLCMTFLGAALAAHTAAKVHITNGDPHRES